MKQKISENIEIIIFLLEQCKSEVKWFTDQQAEAEAAITNLEHELEGVGVTYRTPPNSRQRGPIATNLQREKIRRRIAKDAVRMHQPLMKFTESEVGAKAINQLKQVLGEQRKVESSMDSRIFTERKVESGKRNPAMEKNLNKLIRNWKKRR